MKETIYTIPVTEVFEKDCECPLCLLETKLENEYVEYVLGASLMEPDSRKQTNDKGFCRKHFEQLYNKQENKLGLGLIIDTHITEHNKRFNRITGIKPEYEDTNKPLTNESDVVKTMGIKGAITSLFSKDKSKEGKKMPQPEASAENVSENNYDGYESLGAYSIDRIISYIDEYESKCVICDKLDYTMDRYIEVIYYLYFSEPSFKKIFESKKGFCLHHLKMMLKYAKKFDSKKREQVMGVIMKMQTDNMERIQKEINWFTKKFDYRYENEPWGNSRDAIPRSIKKLMGPCRFK